MGRPGYLEVALTLTAGLDCTKPVDSMLNFIGAELPRWPKDPFRYTLQHLQPRSLLRG